MGTACSSVFWTPSSPVVDARIVAELKYLAYQTGLEEDDNPFDSYCKEHGANECTCQRFSVCYGFTPWSSMWYHTRDSVKWMDDFVKRATVVLQRHGVQLKEARNLFLPM